MIKSLNSNIIALGVCLTAFFFWSILLTYKFIYFGYYDWDLALYSHAMWSLCQGTTYSSLFGTTFLADHAHYIAFLITPLYKLFPHPLTLIHLELFSFFGGAFVAYKIFSKMLDRGAALLLMTVFIIHPANIFMLFYEFHFESLAIGLILLMFYFMFEKRWVAFMVTAALMISVKENMSLIVVMFGAYGLLFGSNSKIRWGLVPLLMGSLFFVCNMFVFMPFFRRGLATVNSIYLDLYSHVGFNLEKLWHQLLMPNNVVYLKELLKPFLYLPLACPVFLLMASSLLAQNLLSNASSMRTIYYHYAAMIVPFLIIATAGALVLIKSRFPLWIYKFICILLLASSVISAAQYWSHWRDKALSWPDRKDIVRQYFIEQIPQEASVIASFDFLSHLSNRKEVYAFFNVFKGANYFNGGRPFKFPQNIQYALIDFHDPWLLADLRSNHNKVQKRIDHFFTEHQFEIKQKYGSIILFQKK